MGRLGSINRQINDLFLESKIFTPGESKHAAKGLVRQSGVENWHAMGKEMTIYSYLTAEQYKDVWHQVARWIKAEYGVRDVTKISGTHVSAWLRHKIDDDGISKNTFRQYAAALEKLGLAISRLTGSTSSFSTELKDVRQYARTVLAKNVVERAYGNPDNVIQNLSLPTSRLVAQIQYESGARIHEVAQVNNSRLTDNGFWVSGKGGFRRELALSPETRAELLKQLAANDGKLRFDYNEYRDDLKSACRKVGESYTGSHSFRYNYARRTFTDELAKNKTYLEALKIVSAKLGHHRASISKHYLR